MNLQFGICAALALEEATVERTPESKALVTYYYIPGGIDVSRITIQKLYFKDEVTAKGFVEKYKDEPEMPSLEKLQ